VLELREGGRCVLTTHSQVPVEWLSDPATEVRGWWRALGPGVITLAKVRLAEPAHATLGIPLSLEQLNELSSDRGIAQWLLSPFEFLIPAAMVVDSANLVIGQEVVVQEGTGAEATISHLTAALIAALIAEETALASGPAAVAKMAGTYGAMLRVLLRPRVADRVGPAAGAFGKRGTVVEVSAPRGVAFSFDPGQDCAAASAPAIGPLSCIGPQWAASSCSCEARCATADGGCRHDGREGVAAFWEGEFEVAWQRRVPPKRRKEAATVAAMH